MLKNLIKSPVAARTASILIGVYLRLLGATSRTEIHDRQYFDDALAQKNGVILAFWHGRLILAPFIRKQTGTRVHMLVSTHRDGEIIVNGASGFDINFIRGSAANPKKPEKTKSGASAVAQIIAALEAGDIVAVTPDGPRGPSETVKAGILKIAELSGAPIIPAGLSASLGPQINSWDRFLLAAPFSKMTYVAGPPIWVSPDTTAQARKEQQRTLETYIKDVTAKADKFARRKTKEIRTRND